MVTVTEADVKIRYLAVWPSGVTAATVTAMCAQAESWIQGKDPETVVLTGAAAVQLSVDLIVNWLTGAQYAHAGGAGATGIQPPPVWRPDMEVRYQSLLMGTDDQTQVVDTVNFDVD